MGYIKSVDQPIKERKRKTDKTDSKEKLETVLKKLNLRDNRYRRGKKGESTCKTTRKEYWDGRFALIINTHINYSLSGEIRNQRLLDWLEWSSKQFCETEI